MPTDVVSIPAPDDEDPIMLRFASLTRTISLLGCSLALASVAHSQTGNEPTWGLTNLYLFQGGISGPDGGTPYGGLILGADGNYYGTTWYGGTGGGTVFKITPQGTESLIYAFSGPQDGQLPSRLVEGTDGNFYGTAYWGGGINGYGIIFKVTPSGQETILQSFANTNGGPANPGAGLTLGVDHNFYGTTTGGGADGQGTFFQMTSAGALTVLYSFGGAAGSSPQGELIEMANGEFYGTTRQGGDGGYGTVFKVNTAGKLKVLHAFAGGTDGAQPASRLLHGLEGAFYGTTQAGGDSSCAFPGLPSGCGTVFRITSAGAESVIYRFAGYPTDGANPVGGLVQDKAGLLYGTTEAGGFTDPGNCGSGCGTIFSVTPAGAERVLYACGAPPQPWYAQCWVPSGALLLSAGSTLTGTSQNGGDGWGNVFSIAPAPTVTLTATPTAVTFHNGTTLKWSSTYAQSCVASGNWSGNEALKGQLKETPTGTGSFTYTLTCAGVGGSTASSVSVTVSP